MHDDCIRPKPKMMAKAKKSILRQLRMYMMLFGIMMGLVFPIYANFFVEWKPGMFIWFLIGCIAAGITVGIVSYGFVKWVLIRKLQSIALVATDLSQKKLPQLLTIESNDEVGLIIDGINACIRGFKVLLEEVENTTNYAKGIIQQVDNAEREDQQASAEQLHGALILVNQLTEQLFSTSGNNSGLVNKGIRSVHQASANLNNTYKAIETYRYGFQQMVQHAEAIAQSLQLIDDIAMQTNILSINASIEAKTVGNIGKGFTVVAQEVGQLAGQTQSTARLITEKVQLMQGEMEQMMQTMDDMVGRVSKNNAEVNEANNDLKSIQNGVEQNHEHSMELQRSTKDMRLLFDSLYKAMGQLNQQIDSLQKEVFSYRRN